MKMRLAVLSDIHGNVPALETALNEIAHIGVDGILVAGDTVAGPHPVEALQRLRDLNCWMIRGNNENYILRFASGDAPGWWYTARQWAFMRWNFQQLDEDSLAFLQSLPEQRVISIPGADSIRVVHGSPRNISELVYPEKDISLLDIALKTVPEPVVIFGHTHEHWQMRRNGRLVLNPGAVCGTFNGRLGGSYAILTLDSGHWEVELRELNYDISLMRKAFEETGLLIEGGAISEHWLYDIENGVNTLPRFVEYAYQMSAEAGHGELPYVPDEIWDAASKSFSYRI
jgi:putative phosphoesterase